MAVRQFLLLSFVIACMVVILTNALNQDHFPNCLLGMLTIRLVVSDAIADEKRMGASLLRLHFHDCFVQGCDGSILLDDTGTFTGEKTALPNGNSVRGYEVIDRIKTKVDMVCGVGKVSCADIVTVAARDSINILGGPYYSVMVGRKDSKTASLSLANANLPPPVFNLSQLIPAFASQGLDLTDLVALSGGAHTIGRAKCVTFRSRIYNNAENIDQNYRMSLQNICPLVGGNTNLTALDVTTPDLFNNAYYRNLLVQKGLFHSDQELYKGDGSAADALVTKYAQNSSAFKSEFIDAMIKMGNIGILTGNQGEITNNCRVVNS